MSRRTFMVLGGVTLALVVIVLLVGIGKRVEYAAAPSQRLLPGLEDRLNDITRVQVRSAAAPPVTLERRGEGWQVAEKGGYPADFGLLRSQLLALARLDKVEAMTKSPDKYQKLGLQDLDQSGSQAKEIRLWGGDKELAAVLVGKTGFQEGSYVRLDGDPQSWLTSAGVTLPARAEDWLSKGLLDLIPNRMQRIAIQPAEGPAYTLVKEDPKKTEFTLDPAPEEGRRLKAFEVQREAAALNALRLDDVVPEAQAPQSDAPWRQARFETFDGLVVEALTRQVNDKQYVKLSARFDPALAERFKAAQGGKAVGQPAVMEPDSSVLQPPDQVKAEAERLQKRFAGWVFVIPAHKALLFSQARDKLVEAPPAQAQGKPGQPSGQAPPAGEPAVEELPLDEELPGEDELPSLEEPPSGAAPLEDDEIPPAEEEPADEAPPAGQNR